MHGEGPRLTVLLHGLLFTQRMHEPLARDLASRGHRVVTLDLLGHGESDRPTRQVALLDAGLRRPGRRAARPSRRVDEAVVLGTSLGANAALESAAQAPERLRGMVIEMPVLDHALLGCRARLHAADARADRR